MEVEEFDLGAAFESSSPFGVSGVVVFGVVAGLGTPCPLVTVLVYGQPGLCYAVGCGGFIERVWVEVKYLYPARAGQQV